MAIPQIIKVLDQLMKAVSDAQASGSKIQRRSIAGLDKDATKDLGIYPVITNNSGGYLA